MADSNDNITDEELLERLAKYGQRVTIKGTMNEAQRQIQKKKLNHLEARERAEKEKAEKAEKEAAKLAKTASSPPRKKSKGGRRKTIATVAPPSPDTEDVEMQADLKLSNSLQVVESRPPLKSPLSSPAPKQTAMMSPSHSYVENLNSSPLTVLVMDVASGCPLKRLSLAVSVQDRFNGWVQLAQRTTDDEGKCPGLVTKDLFHPGTYKIRFETVDCFGTNYRFPYVEVVFQVEDLNQQHHVSLMLTPNSYSTHVNF